MLDFVLATQPKAWKKLEQHHGKEAVREQIERRGALDVLRGGLKDSLRFGSAGSIILVIMRGVLKGLNDSERRKRG